MKHIGRKLVLPAAALAVAGSSFAFLASNTVGKSYAGEGAGVIAGYKVTNVHYSLNTVNQTGGLNDSITAVSFDLNHPAQTVHATIGDGVPNTGQSTDYPYCTETADNGDGTFSWSCSNVMPNSNAQPQGYASLNGATKLTVSAAQ